MAVDEENFDTSEFGSARNRRGGAGLPLTIQLALLFVAIMAASAGIYATLQVRVIKKELESVSQNSESLAATMEELKAGEATQEDARAAAREGAKALSALELKVSEVADTVANLKARADLARLADEAIAYGYRSKLAQLEDTFRSSSDLALKDAANAEIIRVQMFYLESAGILPARIPIKVQDQVITIDQSLNTKALVSVLLAEDQAWQYRSRAAQLLRTRPEAAAVEALLRAMLLDPNLSVLYQTTNSLKALTGCPFNGVFGSTELGEWLEQNKDAVEARLAQIREAAKNASAAEDAKDRDKKGK